MYVSVKGKVEEAQHTGGLERARETKRGEKIESTPRALTVTVSKAGA